MYIVLEPNDILTIHEGCYGDTSCSGTVVLAVYSSNSSSYDDDSHHYYSPSNDDRSNSSSSNVTFSFECSGNKPAVITSINECSIMIAGNTLESTCQYSPTPQPTSNDPVQIEVVQTITDCPYDDYLLAQTKYDKTFKQAIVASLQTTSSVTISISDILNFQVQDTTGMRRKLLQTPTPTLSISYTVQSSSLSASSLSTALTQALSPTTFTNTLQTAAAANGATGFTTATASAPVITNTSPTSAPTVKPTSTSIDSLVKHPPLGAIIGAIAAVLVVGVCSFILYRHYLKKQGKSSVEVDANTNNPLAHRITFQTTETDSKMPAAKVADATVTSNPVHSTNHPGERAV